MTAFFHNIQGTKESLQPRKRKTFDVGAAAFITGKRVLSWEGTPLMSKISRSIREGANAYLKRQYTVVGVFFVCMIVVLCIMAACKLLTWFVPFAFLTAGLCASPPRPTAAPPTPAATIRACAWRSPTVSFTGYLGAGHQRVVHAAALRMRPPISQRHADLRYGRQLHGAVRPCGRRHLHQSRRRGRRPCG